MQNTGLRAFAPPNAFYGAGIPRCLSRNFSLCNACLLHGPSNNEPSVESFRYGVS